MNAAAVGRSIGRGARWFIALFLVSDFFHPSQLVAQLSPAPLPNLQLSVGGVVNSMALQDDGKLVIAGRFYAVNGTPRQGIARLNLDGTVDAVWSPKSIDQVTAVVANQTHVFARGSFLPPSGLVSEYFHASLLFKFPRNGGGEIDVTEPISSYCRGPTFDSPIVVAGDFLFFVRDRGSGLAPEVVKASVVGETCHDPAWAPLLPSEVITVSAMAASGTNLFVAGAFVNTTSSIVKLNTQFYGSRDTNWNPNLNISSVSSMVTDGTNIFVGTLNGKVVKVSALGSGAVDTNWNVTASGAVYALALDGTNLYVGGVFESIGGANKTNLAKVSAIGSGQVVTQWSANAFAEDLDPSSGEFSAVYTLQISSNSLYVGGRFDHVNQSYAVGLARVSTATGQRDESFKPQVQSPGEVYGAAQAIDGKIVIGGLFHSAGGLQRRFLVRANADGTLDTNWNPNPNGPIYGVLSDGTNVFVRGEFAQIGGTNREGFAKLSATGSDAADPLWNPDTSTLPLPYVSLSGTNLFFSDGYSAAKVSTLGTGAVDQAWNIVVEPPFGAEVTVTPSGNDVYVSGNFTNINGVPRNGIARVSAFSGASVDTNWNPNPFVILEPGDYEGNVRHLATDGTNVFAEIFHFDTNGLGQLKLVEISATGSGALDPLWRPDLSDLVNVSFTELKVSGTNLYVVGDFSQISGLPRNRIARFSTTGPGAIDKNWDPHVQKYVSDDYGLPYYLIAPIIKDRDVYLAGDFAFVGSEQRLGFAFVPEPDSPVINLAGTNLFILRNPADGTEVTHFRITQISGGNLFQSDGVTPISTNDFVSVAQGTTGLVFIATVSNATVVATSVLTTNVPPDSGEFVLPTLQTDPASLPNLKLSDGGIVSAIARQADGKIVVGGTFESISGTRRANLARLNPNGTLDTTWDSRARRFGGIGSAFAIAIDGNNIFAGGSLTYIDLVDNQYRYRNGLAKLNSSDGDMDPDWDPHIVEGVVKAVLVSGTNIYVGGGFIATNSTGQMHTNLVRMNMTGVIDSMWKPDPDGEVRALLEAGTNLYAGGTFSHIGNQSRNRLVKLSTGNSAIVDIVWNPNINPAQTNGTLSEILSLAANSDSLFIAGLFDRIGNVTQRVAKVSLFGTGAIDTNWNPSANANVTRLSIVGTNLFIGGQFTLINNSSRLRLAKLNLATGAPDANWQPVLSGEPLALLASGNDTAVFVGGVITNVNDTPVLGIAKLDQISGSRDRLFDAQIEVPGNVTAAARQPDGSFIIGGSFSRAGNLLRQNLARVHANGTLDIAWAPSIDYLPQAIAADGTNIFVAGFFNKVNGINQPYIAKLNSFSGSLDTNWNPISFGSAKVETLTIAGTNLIMGGNFGQGVLFRHPTGGSLQRSNLVKVSLSGVGAADPAWNPNPSGAVYTLAVLGNSVFAGGEFLTIGGLTRTNVAKLNLNGTGSADPAWNAFMSYPTNSPYSRVATLEIVETNLFIGGGFSSVGGQVRNGIAKVSVSSGALDMSWNPAPFLTTSFAPAIYHFVASNTNLFVYGNYVGIGGRSAAPLAKLSTLGDGLADPFWQRNQIYGFPVSANGSDVYVAGATASYLDTNFFNAGLLFLPVPDAPQLIQDTPTNLFIARNAADGPEITHFRITGLRGGPLYRSDGVTRVNAGDFLTVAEGNAGMKFVAGGTISVVSAVNNRGPEGAGIATSTLTMSANPLPVFKLSATSYSVREDQDNIVVTVRKFGNFPASVGYATSNLTATGGVDYQTRSGTLNFSATDKFKNVIIAIANDLQPEGDEQFTFTLMNPGVPATIAGPEAATVTIQDNDLGNAADSLTTTVMPASPPVSTGMLTVSLQPANAAGQWRLVGELNWHDSGARVSGLVSGNYSIEFRQVNGYFPPSATAVTVPVSAGATNQFLFFYISSANLDMGNLSVVIQPDDVATAVNTNSRGQWRRVGETAWRDSRDIVPNLSAGTYTVEFKPVSGRVTPSQQLIQVGGGNATYGTVGTYFFGATPGAQTPVVVPFVNATTNAPYLYNGQIQTDIGFGSGFVVKQRVVLTAAHVLFDDLQLSYVTSVRWFFQRYRDKLEPVPQTPRGWYVFEGYASQRQLDNSPNISTPASQNLDATAMYFLEDAGRGGYGGYLSTDADNNEYLLSANNKFLCGYPLDGVDDADEGKLFATAPANLNFTRLYTSVFATTNIAGFPGNSGGPLYVQSDVNQYLPAAIYLGGSGETLVRAINSEVVDLINRAETSGNGGGNSTGGGATLLSPGQTVSSIGTGILNVSVTPSNAMSIRPGWRIAGLTDTNYFDETAFTTVAVIGGGSYPIEFKPVPGFITPSNRTVLVAVNGLVAIQAAYVGIRPQLTLNRTNGLVLSGGGTGATYRVEFKTNLTIQTTWTPLTSFTLSASSLLLSDTRPATNGNRFYRAVLVP